MTTNNSQNSQYANNADGFTLGGGTTTRSLTVTGGNVTVTGAGSNTYTMPAASDTLVGRASTDTLTNKTLTTPVIDQLSSSSGLGAAYTTYSPSYSSTGGTPTSVTTNKAAYKQIGKIVTMRVDFTVVTVGTATGHIKLTLPVTALDTSNAGTGLEIAATGFAASVYTETTSLAGVTIYSGMTGWVAGYRWIIEMTYEAA